MVEDDHHRAQFSVQHLAHENSPKAFNLRIAFADNVQADWLLLQQTQNLEHLSAVADLLQPEGDVREDAHSKQLALELYIEHLVKGLDEAFFGFLLRGHLQELLMSELEHQQIEVVAKELVVLDAIGG